MVEIIHDKFHKNQKHARKLIIIIIIIIIIMYVESKHVVQKITFFWTR